MFSRNPYAAFFPTFRAAARVQAMPAFLYFALALVATDQALLRWGNRLIQWGRFRDDIYLNLAPKPRELLLLGDCRPLAVPADHLSRVLDRPVRNVGLGSSGLAHIVFGSAVLLSSAPARGATAAIFLNDEILEQTAEKFEQELERTLIWWPHLSPEMVAWFLAQPGGQQARNPWLQSGLYKYRGRGFELIKATAGWALSQAPSPSDFSSANFFFGQANLAGRESNYHPPATQYTESAFAMAWLNATLDQYARRGVNVVLVLSPMHWKRSSDRVNDTINESVRALAQRHGAHVLSYLGNSLEWAKHSEWYGEPGHLNNQGAQIFGEQFAADLQGVLP